MSGLTLPCPDCGAAVRGAEATVVPCPRCGNPLLMQARSRARQGARAHPGARARPADAARSPEPRRPAARPQVPWAKVAGFAALLILVHVVAGWFLTRSARAEVADIESRHGELALLGAKEPSEAPTAGSPAYAEWAAAQEVYESSLRWSERRDEIQFTRNALILALLLQLGLTAFVLTRTWQSQKRALAR